MLEPELTQHTEAGATLTSSVYDSFDHEWAESNCLVVLPKCIVSQILGYEHTENEAVKSGFCLSKTVTSRSRSHTGFEP